ncbi:MAG: VWA-like domain-containing protein [Candidatus Fimimorpha sp.]
MPETQRIQLEEIGRRIWNASRNELYISMRFLDLALASLEPKMNLNTRTIGTDGVHILYNPSYIMDRYRADSVLVNRDYLHLLLHCIFRHMMKTEERDAEQWNFACDIAVEAILDGMQERCVHLVPSDEREQIYDQLRSHMKVLTAEGIYHFFQGKQISYSQFLEWRKEFAIDDHNFWEYLKDEPSSKSPTRGQSNHSSEKESPKSMQKQPPLTKEQQRELADKWKDISERMKTNLETISKGREKESGNLTEILRIETRQKQDYTKFLKRFAVTREEMQIDPDSFDYGFYTYGLQLYKNMPLIEPYEFQEMTKIQQFVIAIDTSGSCKAELVQQFLNATYDILKSSESFFKKMDIHIVECDAKVQKDIVIHSQKDLMKYIDSFCVEGFGGTDFRPVFEYIEQLRKNNQLVRLKGLIYFTDGCGIYPKKKPDYDVAFVFFKQDYTDEQVPPWAMKLIIGEEEIKEFSHVNQKIDEFA